MLQNQLDPNFKDYINVFNDVFNTNGYDCSNDFVIELLSFVNVDDATDFFLTVDDRIKERDPEVSCTYRKMNNHLSKLADEMLSYNNNMIISHFMDYSIEMIREHTELYPNNQESLDVVVNMLGVMNGSLEYWLNESNNFDWDHLRAELQNGPEKKETDEEKKKREEEEKKRKKQELREKISQFVQMDAAGAALGSYAGPGGTITGAVLSSGYIALTWD